MGIVACVGAAFTGDYNVGLGMNAEEAFEAYLNQLAGVSEPIEPTTTEKTLQGLLQESNMHLQNYLDLWSQGRYKEAGEHLEQFLELWQQISEQLSETPSEEEVEEKE